MFLKNLILRKEHKGKHDVFSSVIEGATRRVEARVHRTK